ncbi:MAG TPA: SigB/SigF/SigG family RNA polymerase sigma factor, partial [Pseudonocardiaceae bacterium]|nr:SigB/SigF/SigG family RNA polymerase sigma factor [Pseudonocardiaceae bacterium]
FHRLTEPGIPERQRRRARDALFAGHLPLAEHIALRYRDRGQSLEDLQQVARLGLFLAVTRFDPSRGSDFVAFAVPTITGELRRYFRDMTWAVAVPRRVKELRATVSAAAARLAQEGGRTPRPSQIAEELGIPVEDVYEGLQANYAYRTTTLDTDDPGGTDRQSYLGHTDTRLDLAEHRTALYPALDRLPERERSIVIMRFYEDLTQSQIARRVGLSQMHVSRLLSRSLAILREQLATE